MTSDDDASIPPEIDDDDFDDVIGAGFTPEEIAIEELLAGGISPSDRKGGSVDLRRSISMDGVSIENPAAFSVGVGLRDATILVCDVRSMHSFLKGAGNLAREAIQNLSVLVDALAETAKSYNGSFEGITGDKIILTWNVVRECSTHQFGAVMCAVEFIRKMRELPFVGESRLDVLMMIASGNLLRGTVGNDVKGCVSFGRPCSLVYAMKKALAAPLPRLGTEIPYEEAHCSGRSFIIVDDVVREAAKEYYDMKIVASVDCDGRLSRLFRVGRSLRVCRASQPQPPDELIDHGPSLSAKEMSAMRTSWNAVWERIEGGAECTQIRMMLLRLLPAIPLGSSPLETFDAEGLLQTTYDCEKFDLVHRMDAHQAVETVLDSECLEEFDGEEWD